VEDIMQEIPVGLIGGGFMARVHSLGYAALPYFFWPRQVTMGKRRLADQEEGLARQAAERFGWEEHTCDWRAVAEASDIGLVDICTPNDLHAEIALSAIAAGKNILCEKPLAMSADEAWTMYEAAEQAGVVHAVGFNYRMTPAVQMAKRLIDEGKIGRIYHFRGFYLQDFGIDPKLPLSWRFQAARAGSGSLGDIGAHVIDMAQYLVGDLARVTADAETFVHDRPLATSVLDTLAMARQGSPSTARGTVDVDDGVSFLIRFANGAMGTIEATRFAYGRKNHLAFEVNGDCGSIRFDWERRNELYFYSADDPADQQGFKTIIAGPPHPYGEAMWPMAGIGTGYLESTVILLQELSYALAGKGGAMPTFEDGWKVCAVLDAVQESARQGNWVTIPPMPPFQVPAPTDSSQFGSSIC